MTTQEFLGLLFLLAIWSYAVFMIGKITEHINKKVISKEEAESILSDCFNYMNTFGWETAVTHFRRRLINKGVEVWRENETGVH